MEFIYTPQQLAGYKGYNARVRVGNWSEDMEHENTRLKDYLFKKDNGLLKCTEAERRFANALQPVKLGGEARSGIINFGDAVMIFNQQTDGCVACDTEDAVTGQTNSFAATTTWYTEPCARTTFIIEKYEGKADQKDAVFNFSDNQLHFGQKFRIRVHPAFSDKVLYLASYSKSPLRFARYSREQEVCVTTDSSWNTVWEVVCMDPQYKLEMEGQPVQAAAPFMLRHLGTNNLLASDKITYRNDFGAEYELFGKTYQDVQKGQYGARDRNLIGEQNRFCFINSEPDTSEQQQ